MSRIACDVIVVGGELVGLCAAALIAQHPGGKRVIVIDDADPCLRLPLGDRFAPTTPSLLRLPNGPAGAVLDGLGVKQDARRILGELGGLGIIDDPDIRMVVPVDPDSRTRELIRVFGADEGARAAVRLHDLTSEGRAGLVGEAALLHEDGFFEKRRHKKRLEALGGAGSIESEDAVATLLSSFQLGVAAAQLVPFVQGLPAAKPTSTAGLWAALQLQAGVHGGSKGGLGPRAALSELLADVVRRRRGEVQRARVESIDADGKHLTAVHASGANDYVARVIIDATSRRDLTLRIPEGRRRDKLLAAEQHVQPARDVAVARWLLPSLALPRGLPPVSLVLRPEGAVLVGVYAGASLKEGQKGAGLDENLVAIVAAAVCPLGEGEQQAAVVDDVLDRLLPFAKPVRKAHDVISGATAQGAMPQWVVVESEHGIQGRRPVTPFANLLRAGRDLTPGLGIDGELMAARSVAAAAEHLLGATKRSDAA